MERRDMLFGMGAVVMGAATLTSRALGGQDMAGMAGMHHGGAAKNQALIDSANHCASAAEACTTHSLKMIAAGDKALLDCAAKTRELAVVCSGLAALGSQDAPELQLYARLTAQISDLTEAECRKFPQHPPCVACADACKACAVECRKLG